MKKTITIFSLLGTVLLSSWGFLAHKTINQLAIYSLPKSLKTFFFINKDYLVYNSVRPDVRRNTDKTEDTKHFVDADAPVFGGIDNIPENWNAAIAKFSEDTLRKYGTVTYEVMRLQEKLTNAFRKQQKDSILFYAADLGHYIADAHVPLHTTINYDGQLSNQKGLHSLWESTLPEMNIQNYTLYQTGKVRYLKNPQHEIWMAFRESYRLLNGVLTDEIRASVGMTDEQKYNIQVRNGVKQKRYSGEFAKKYAELLGKSVNQRLLQSTEMVANFWYTAWYNAGCPDLSKIQPITTEQQTQLELEMEAWKNNELLKKGWLQAKEK